MPRKSYAGGYLTALILLVTVTVASGIVAAPPDGNDMTRCNTCDNVDKVCYWNDPLPAWREFSQNATKGKFITDNNGQPFTAWASKAVGPANTVMLSDTQLVYSLLQVNRERIPERVAHAKGHCARGFFKVTTDALQNFTRSEYFTKVNETYPCNYRFSTTGGSLGSHDGEQDLRGMVAKCYGPKGNYDFMFLNSPCFALWDPLLFTSLMHSTKKHPQTNCQDPNMKWDFIAHRHESLCMNVHVMTDIGCPKSVCNMPAHGVHTFVLINKEGKKFFAKISLVPQSGVLGLSDEERERKGPDYLGQDLWDKISKGEPCIWDVFFQILPEKSASEVVGFNAMDVTRTWSKDAAPPRLVGIYVVNKHITNHFEECELFAASPSHLPDGITLGCADPIADARSYAYPDAQHYRMGASFNNFPVNRPISPVLNHYRDTFPTGGFTQDASPSYYPNSFSSATLGPVLPSTCGSLSGPGNRIDTLPFMHTFDECILLVGTWSPNETRRYAKRFAREWMYLSQPVIRRVFDLFSNCSCTLLKIIMDFILELVKAEPRLNKSYLPGVFNALCVDAGDASQ